VSVENHLEPLSAEWDDLADRCAPAPFMRTGWIAAWWRAFGGGTLELLCARDAGRLVGLLPLRRRSWGVDSPTNYHTLEFGMLAESDDARRALARAVFARHPGRVSIGFLSGERRDPIELQDAARAHGYRVIVDATSRSPYVPIHSDWAGYERRLSRNMRGDLRRTHRRLEEQGAISIDYSEGGEHFETLLEECFAVDARSWKAGANTAIVSHANTRQFYEHIGHWAASRGSLRLALLRVEGRPVAMQMGLEEEGVHFAIKASYDASYSRFSPGKLLMHAIVEGAFRRGLKSVELLGADEPYKQRWASHSRERLTLRAYAGSPIGWLAWRTDVHGRPLARRAGLARVRRKLRRIR
jgi:CelD/BcsL family acetyltransferase involved in cellulose biosynthesis